MTQADTILQAVFTNLGIHNHTDEQKYQNINQIVAALFAINQINTINPKTTGTISERLCELGLRAKVNGIYKPISGEWNWMADFSILGHPFNLLISVKSFKAKERLLVSGSGNLLSPTVGWGLFDDPNEWTADRTKIYLFRSFIAIYLPSALYQQLPQDTIDIKNINGKPFLRPVDNFMDDLENAILNNTIDIRLF